MIISTFLCLPKHSVKQLLLILVVIFCSGKLCAQYGNQSAITIPISETDSAVALIHLPDNYNKYITNRYPLIVGLPGAGKHGTDTLQLTEEGLGNAIYTGTWDGNAVNPATNNTEKFVAISILPPGSDAPISFSEIDYALTWIYAHYRIDTSCVALSGLSRGGGTTIYYPSHISYVTYTDHFIYEYSTPSHLLSAIIPMSAENNQDDSVNYVVSDSVAVWGFGSDTIVGEADAHGVSTHLFIKHINAIAPLARFTNYVGGHCCWDVFYNSSYKETINGLSMNIYQFALFHKRVGITTGKLNGAPFCFSDSVGTALSVPFISVGKYNAGNEYKVQLSNATGSYSEITIIGTMSSTDNSGTINCIIPPGILKGKGYRIRVNSTTPHIEGTSTSDFIITATSNKIALNGAQNITAGKNGVTLTVTEATVPLYRKWKYGKTIGDYNVFSGKGVTTESYVPNFPNPGTYYVVCKSFYACDSVVSNPIKINVSDSYMNDAVAQNLTQQTTLKVFETLGYVSCNYAVMKNEKVNITIYDVYGRARESFNDNPTTGSYTHKFHHLLPGLYVVVFQSNQQKNASQKILVSN